MSLQDHCYHSQPRQRPSGNEDDEGLAFPVTTAPADLRDLGPSVGGHQTQLDSRDRDRVAVNLVDKLALSLTLVVEGE